MLSSFLTSFIVVGLAELGDKTQIALVLLASKTDKRFHLLLGAFLGFLLVDGVSVALGAWVSSVISGQLLKTVSGLVFIAFGVLMLRSGGSEGGGRLVSANPLLSSFLLIALTEWGDKTQIAAALFAAEYEPLLVLAGALSALTLLSALAVYLGSKLSDRVDPEKTRKLGAAVFIILGLTFLLAAAGGGVPDSQTTTTTLPLAERLRVEAYGKVGVPCSSDADCSLPMKYAVLSHCPYGMACLSGRCAVVCPMWVHDPDPAVSRSYPLECDSDSDCDCTQWSTVGSKDCVCHNSGCLAVAAVEPEDTDFEVD